MDTLGGKLKHHTYYKGDNLPALEIKVINKYDNTGIQDKIKKNKIIINTAKYILIIQIKKKKFLGTKNLKKRHYITRPYDTPLKTKIPNGLIQFKKGKITQGD